MRIAIPTVGGILCPHFGHCQQFAFVDVDPEKKEILKTEMVVPPAHQPGALPVWIGQHGCNMIIAGGMGGRAIGMFQQSGINVVIGASPEKPEDVVMAYLNGTLTTDGNPCADEPGFRQNGGHNCGGHKQG